MVRHSITAQAKFQEALDNAEEHDWLGLYNFADDPILSELGRFSNVEELSISGPLPGQALDALASMPKLRKLDLDDPDMVEIPPQVLELDQLQDLRLKSKGLTEIPASIASLTSLSWLFVGQGCRISAVAPELYGLPLTSLNLSHNAILELSPEIGTCTTLKNLFVGYAGLSELPDAIGNLVNLRLLGLNANRLTGLPDSMVNLTRLEHLDLRGNQFESFPAGFGAIAQAIDDLKIKLEHRKLLVDWSYPVPEATPVIELDEMHLFIEAGDPGYDEALAVLDANGIADRIAGVRRAIKVTTTEPDDYTAPGTSRAGGFPDLASPDDLPTTDGSYWIFLAQIDLADIADLNAFLPRTGLLSFFAASLEDDECLVHYTPAPFDELTTVRYDPAEMLDDQDDYTPWPFRLAFESATDIAYSQLPDDDEAHDRVAAAVLLKADHAMNAETFTQGESPQQVAAGQLRGSAEEWVPLLRLGFDKNTRFCFWDAGDITFSIHHESLRRADFSNVHMHLESS